MKRLMLAMLFVAVVSFAGQVLACGLKAHKSGSTEGAGTDLASEYSLSGK